MVPYVKSVFFSGIFLCATALGASAQNVHRCGNEALLQRLAATDPTFAQKRQQRLQAERQFAQQNTAAKGTAQYAIPVAFHILVSPAQYTVLGGDTGIIRRVNSQLAVLNADYSATNSDIGSVPGPFQSLIGNSGLQFRLASGTNAATIAPGIEVKKTAARFDDYSSYADAKRAASGGLDGWNQSQNLNVWVVQTTNGTLGVAVPPSILGSQNTNGPFVTADLGLVVSHTAFGKRDFPAQYFFPSENDGGRTLTHEIGHYFELEHVFGEDYGCGLDDGIADTPPQAEPTFSYPSSPAFPLYDNCSPTGNGIMFMNYMDYVDDAEMMFFTNGQALRMQLHTSPGHASYSLTQQNPLGVAEVAPETLRILLSPNPNSGNFQVLNNSNHPLSNLMVVDITGREVYQSPTALPAGETQPIALPALSKGIYFLKGTLGSETFTQKIVLQ